MMKSTYVTAILASLIAGSQAFTMHSVVKSAPSSTHLYQSDVTSTGWDSFERMKNGIDIPSGEEQRVFRRTVYTHDDWKKHRDQDRFIVYLAAIFKSGVYKNLQGEVTLATAIAAFVCVYNGLVGGFTDLEGVKQAAILASPLLPKLGLPLNAFTLTSPSLGLLLGK